MTLATIEKVLFLRGVDLFGDLESEDLVPIARIAEEVTIPAGDRFIVRGEIGDRLYLLVEGEVGVVLDGVGELARRGPRSVVGEMAVISRRPRAAHCVALSEVTALTMAHDDFWELLEHYPPLARAAIGMLTRRLDEAIENLARYRVGSDAPGDRPDPEVLSH